MIELSHESNIVATCLFAVALLHTFATAVFQRLAQRYPEGTAGENFFHLLGEVEIVFGIWAGVFVAYLAVRHGFDRAVAYVEQISFTEPFFIFVILAVCSSRPILKFASRIVELMSFIFPFSKNLSFIFSALILGPLLGSLITEPAAMTITALILSEKFFTRAMSDKLKYAALGLLFVNISIGGTLSHFAAPPVLMVAQKWGWDTTFMLTHFGWKAVLAVITTTGVFALLNKKELFSKSFFETFNEDSNATSESKKNGVENAATMPASRSSTKIEKIPLWVTGIHLIFLVLLVFTSHHVAIFLGLFMFFLGVAEVTKEYQDEIRLKQGLLVAFFLSGLIILGGPQKWWLAPVVEQLNDWTLYLGTTTLTAFLDNAALTFLGSQIESLTESAKYFLVAGAVIGGGLTVIANAPNPIGYSLLGPYFEKNGFSHVKLMKGALLPTLIALLYFWFL